MAIATATGTGADGTAAPEGSGTTVPIVGCGFGGIAAAIERYRKGHNVVVFGKSSEIGGLGDYFRDFDEEKWANGPKENSVMGTKL